MNMKLIFMAVVLFLADTVVAQEKTIATRTANQIEYDYFAKHLKYLASDELEGRDVGSVGYAKAAEYIALESKINGLLPFGENGSFFQTVPFARTEINTSNLTFNVKGAKKEAKGRYGKDITVILNKREQSSNYLQDLVFVGYGNIIPELNIDDYKNIDVKGKTVIITEGGPKGIKHGSTKNIWNKMNNAFKKGATGVIVYSPMKKSKEKKEFKKHHRFSFRSKLSLKRHKKKSPQFTKKWLDIIAYAKTSFIKEIMEVNDLKLSKELRAMKKGAFVSKPLSSRLHFSYRISDKDINCKNVIALLPGTDPVLKNEYIVVGAHLDHVGIRKSIEGDSIYNGMWDNASGSAAVISLAKAFSQLGINKRSIIFAHYTAEEKGLIGSRYYANSELLKGKKVVANINIDMLAGLYETYDITPIGYSHSNLSEAADFAAKELKLSINDPTSDEKKYIKRSDQMSFIRRGVPVLWFTDGATAIEPDVDVKAEIKHWMKTRYHKPNDDLNQKYSRKGFHTALKANFLALYFMANEMEEIKWKKESPLYKRYVRKREKNKRQAK